MNILRNFISTFKHFKMATILNILGLSVAFTAFMIIAMQVWYEYSYDRFHRDVDRIYRIELIDNSTGQASANIPRPFAEGLALFSPHIQKMALMSLTERSVYYALAIEGQEGEFKEHIAQVSPSFPMLFHFNFLVGDSTSLEHPNQIILPESIAKRLFGSVNALGKLLKVRRTVLTVGGIYKDFPLNSLVKNTIYAAIPPTENKNSWENFNYDCFVLLDNSQNKQEVIDHLIADYKTGNNNLLIGTEAGTKSLRFDILPSIHFDKTIIYDLSSKGSKNMLIILSLIGLLIVLIAAINFINFSTALTPLRIKSINTQKVLGASNAQLRAVLILESIAISFFSFLIGLVVLKLVFSSPLVSLFHVDMFLSNWKAFTGITLSLALFVGFLAGVYPAFYMTSFSPALVLKGSLGLAKGGDKLRNTLISIQLITSMVLIIATVFIYLQNEFMQKSTLGFHSNQTLAVALSQKAYAQRTALEGSLTAIAGVKAVTYAEQFLASSDDNYMTWTQNYGDSAITFTCIPVDPSFLKTMGIPVIAGRDFRTDDTLTDYGAFVFNETAQRQYHIILNEKKVSGIPIVGIIPDLNFMSMRRAIEPLAFHVWGKKNWGRSLSACYIQLNTPSTASIIQQVRAALKLYDPNYPFDINNYSSIIQNNYTQERTLNTLITLFSLIAIFISMVGVFGLVVFESQYRRKEIGIRKVHGAKTGEIILSFNKTYLKLVGLCFLLAAPIAFYFVKQWLTNFAYKTPIHLWVFVVALLIVSLITCITVTIQSWSTANENPVKSIQ